MNLFELFVKIGVDDQASSRISKIASGLGKGLQTAAKVGVAAVGAASTAIVALGKIGFDYNKQIETYTTNFEVMMGDAAAAAKKVDELKEMGASTPFELADLANATQTLLAFNVSADESTGVLSKLGDISLGNVQKLESLTRAYGKMNASQKVSLEDINMMIDAGFNPLLIVAEETGKTMTEVYDDISKGKVSFEQIEDAISKATSAGGQFYQGMQKASQTTEGLISTLKDNATALVGEVYMPISEGLTNTVLPSAINAINTLSEAFKENGINGMIAAAGEMLGSLVNSIVEYAPKVVDTAVTLVNSLIQGLSDNQESIGTGAIQIIASLANGILNMLPQIVALGLDLIVSLAEGISENFDELLPVILETVLKIGEVLIEHAPELINAGIELAAAVIGGILEQFGDFAPLITGVVAAFTAYNAVVNAGQVVTAAMTIASKAAAAAQWLVNAALNANPIGIVVALIAGLVAAVITLWNTNEGFRNALISAWEAIKGAAETIFNAVANFFTETIPNAFNSVIDWFKNIGKKFSDIGKNIIDGIKSGIENAWNNLVSWFKGLFGDLIGIAKKILGIASPSKVFKKIGGFTAEGFGEGFEDEFAHVKDDMEDALNFDDASVGINASIRKVGAGYAGGAFGGTSIGNITINIDGAKYSDEQSLASAIALEIQNMTDRRAAVYA